MSSPSSRIESAKRSIQTAGNSPAQQRENLRHRFQKRLKLTRSTVVDKLRQILDDDKGDFYGNLVTVRKMIEDKDGMDLNVEDMNEVLDDIKKEIDQVLAEQYVNQCQQEVETIANNLMDVCNMCNGYAENGNICKSCSNEMLQEFFC